MDEDDKQKAALGERLTLLLRTAQKNFVHIRSFMRVMDIGLHAAGPEFYPAMESSLKGMFSESQPEPPSDLLEAAAKKAVETRLSDAASAAEAAILLFGHSVLDSATTDLCQIIAGAAPDLWEDALLDRKVRLRDVKECDSYMSTLHSILKSHLSEVERKSLIERIRLITQKCYPGLQPLPVFQSMWSGDFKLDLKRIESIDQGRHDIIHRAELSGAVHDFEDDLEYCELTLTYLVKIVSLRFALPLGDGGYGPGVEKLTVTSVHKGGMA